MTTCTIRRISFEEREGRKLFVPDPGNRGRYLLTDPCVVLRGCWCGAVQFEPCKHKSGYTAGTHADRRHRNDRTDALPIGDLIIDEEITIEPLEGPESFPYLG